jgi:hypothetical protein
MLKHFLLLLIACSAIAQNDTEFIIGEWSIITMGDSEIFYERKTGEIKLLETSTVTYTKDELGLMKERIEAVFIKNTYKFGSDGKAVLTTGAGEEVSAYTVDEKKKQIVVTGKNDQGENVDERYQYEIIGKNLRLMIPLSNDTLLVTLEKVQ